MTRITIPDPADMNLGLLQGDYCKAEEWLRGSSGPGSAGSRVTSRFSHGAGATGRRRCSSFPGGRIRFPRETGHACRKIDQV